MKEENKMELLEIKIRNLTFIVVLGFVIVGLLVIGLYFVKDSNGTSNGTSGGNTTTQVKYDVSAMKKISGEEAAKLFDNKGVSFLYIGRPGCSVCQNLVPELTTVVNDLKMTLYYTEVESSWKNDLKDLFDHLDMEVTIQSEKGTYGQLLKDHGYTPYIIVIKDGKMVDGFVGYRTSDSIKTLFKKYM